LLFSRSRTPLFTVASHVYDFARLLVALRLPSLTVTWLVGRCVLSLHGLRSGYAFASPLSTRVALRFGSSHFYTRTLSYTLPVLCIFCIFSFRAVLAGSALRFTRFCLDPSLLRAYSRSRSFTTLHTFTHAVTLVAYASRSRGLRTLLPYLPGSTCRTLHTFGSRWFCRSFYTFDVTQLPLLYTLPFDARTHTFVVRFVTRFGWLPRGWLRICRFFRFIRLQVTFHAALVGLLRARASHTGLPFFLFRFGLPVIPATHCIPHVAWNKFTTHCAPHTTFPFRVPFSGLVRSWFSFHSFFSVCSLALSSFSFLVAARLLTVTAHFRLLALVYLPFHYTPHRYVAFVLRILCPFGCLVWLHFSLRLSHHTLATVTFRLLGCFHTCLVPGSWRSLSFSHTSLPRSQVFFVFGCAFLSRLDLSFSWLRCLFVWFVCGLRSWFAFSRHWFSPLYTGYIVLSPVVLTGLPPTAVCGSSVLLRFTTRFTLYLHVPRTFSPRLRTRSFTFAHRSFSRGLISFFRAFCAYTWFSTQFAFHARSAAVATRFWFGYRTLTRFIYRLPSVLPLFTVHFRFRFCTGCSARRIVPCAAHGFFLRLDTYCPHARSPAASLALLSSPVLGIHFTFPLTFTVHGSVLRLLPHVCRLVRFGYVPFPFVYLVHCARAFNAAFMLFAFLVHFLVTFGWLRSRSLGSFSRLYGCARFTHFGSLRLHA